MIKMVCGGIVLCCSDLNWALAFGGSLPSFLVTFSSSVQLNGTLQTLLRGCVVCGNSTSDSMKQSGLAVLSAKPRVVIALESNERTSALIASSMDANIISSASSTYDDGDVVSVYIPGRLRTGSSPLRTVIAPEL